MPRARLEFRGEAWELSWTDWDRRWKLIQQKLVGPETAAN
jgi:hypothetical protein